MAFIHIKQSVDSNPLKLFLRWSVLLPPPSFPDKYSYEIGLLLADPLTVHSPDPSIDSSRTKEVVFVLISQSEVNL